MDLINNFMNLVAFPATIFSLLLLLPPYLFLKSVSFVLRHLFKEKVDGKVILITGASSGIGECLAYQYAKSKARLSLVARREDRLQEVADRARSYGSPEVLVFQGDVSKVEDCRRFVDETVNTFGKLDHLVNNAGISSISMLEEATDITNLRPVMEINFWGSIYPTYFAIPHLRKSKGKIAAMSSIAGWMPIPKHTVYNASKAALLNFFEGLRVELSPDIGVTIITPGFIESELSQGKTLSKEGEMTVDPDMRDVIIGAVPVGYAEGCAKAILNGMRRGDRYVTQPAWFKVTYWWKAFCPEILEWMACFSKMHKAGVPSKDTLSKKILDTTGVKNVLNPESIRDPNIKAE